MGVGTLPQWARRRDGHSPNDATTVWFSCFRYCSRHPQNTLITSFISKRLIFWVRFAAIKIHPETFCSMLFASCLFSARLVALIEFERAEFSPIQITLDFRVNDCIQLIGISLYCFLLNEAFDFQACLLACNVFDHLTRCKLAITQSNVPAFAVDSPPLACRAVAAGVKRFKAA